MNSYLLAQAPLLFAVLAVLVISGAKPFRPDRISLWVSIVGLVLSAALLVVLVPGSEAFGGSFVVTMAGKYFAFVLLLLTALVMLLTHGYFEKTHIYGTDWRLIVLCIVLGGFHVAFAGDLATLFLAFQLVSLPAYALTGFSRFDARSNEAGMKYLILGLLSTAFLLFGFAFLYGASGETNLAAMQAKLFQPFGTGTGAPYADLARIGLLFVLAALFFKTAAAPFHTYLLDVYQGSSFAAVAVIGVLAKVAYFAALLRLLHGPLAGHADLWRPALAGAAVLSFVFGGLQGLAQHNLKRILACSSVINTGFLLLAIAYAEARVVAFYLFVYGAMTIALLAFWMRLGTRRADVDTLDDLRGLGRRHPWLATGLSITLLSLAGVPLTAGFVSKFFVVFAVFRNAFLDAPAAGPASGPVAAVLGVLGSVLAAYFYFGVVRTMWFRPETTDQPTDGELDARWNYTATAIIALAVIVILGVRPGLF